MARIRPSKPRLMARVLDAVMSLGDNKGSSAREVLSFIRQGNASLKNLTLQVQRALKHAVNAGLLRHRSGRYKVLATLNPAPTPVSPAKEPADNDQKSERKKTISDVQTPMDNTKSSSRAQKRKKGNTSRRHINKHSDNTKRKTQSSSRRRTNGSTRDRERRQRKRAHEEEELEVHSPGRYVLYGKDESSVPFNRKGKRSRISKQELESSDFSDGSDRESDVDRKRVPRASTSSRREPKRKEARARSRGRSTSRTRSAQRVQARQHLIEEVENDRHQCDENHGLTERDMERQESREDVGDRQPNDGNDGDDNLENS